MDYIPSEDNEEIYLKQYCDDHGLVNWHVSNETWTTSWKAKAMNKAKGVLEGVSDHWVILPTERWGVLLVVIELKKQKGNTPSDAQIKFIHDIDQVGKVVPFCAYGAAEAIKVIEELQQGVDTKTLLKCEQRLEKIYENRQKKLKKRSQQSELPPAENGLPY